MKAAQNARLELRLPKQKKDLFEEVASIGGFKSLTDFILFAADQQAAKLTEQQDQILHTRKDRIAFFDALMNPQDPNQALRQAFQGYQQAIAEK